MFAKSISGETKLVFQKMSRSDLAQKFYLAGGTALAVQLGHRESIDLDWFCQTNLSSQGIKTKLASLGNFQLTGESESTIHGVLDNVRLSFLRYPYKLLYPLLDFEKIKLADERDVAAMKIDAVSSRGSKKDFIDIFFLLKKYSLDELIGFFEKKYSEIDYNKLHILKSLVYFADAEDEPMPIMIRKTDWEEVKKNIQKMVNKLLKFNL